MPTSVDHPRPFLQRDWESLDGPWQFSRDPDELHRGPDDPPFADTIAVPFAPETPASGIAATEFVRCCWYRRALGIAPRRDGERVVLHFGGIDRIADVWVGGQYVAHHVGGYTAFSVDITDSLTPDAQLVVRAFDDPLDLEVPRGKQDWLPTPHAIWYPPTTGIWKTVWLERVQSTHIESVHWIPDVASMSVTARLRIAGPLTDGLWLGIDLSVLGTTLVNDTITITDRTVERTYPLGDGGFDDRFSLVWWPASPTLIDAELVLKDDHGDCDEASSYTALRSVEVADGQLKLNGRPYPLRFVLDQGYWPDTGATPPSVTALRHDIELTKALGFNGTRKHQKVEDQRYFALADRLGLLCWVEMPSAYRPGPRTAAAVLAEWTQIVDAHRSHPSVIGWVPINESWGVPACEQDPSQRSLISALAAICAAVDGTRPISANDGWETIGGDIVGVHDYDQDPTVIGERWGSAEAADAILRSRRPDGKAADLDQLPLAGRALVLSEFGGIALATDTDGNALGFGTANWGYDSADSADDLLRRYRSQWAAVHASSVLVGACWTQLTDTYQEVNGLLRMDRTPKVDLDALRAATRGR